MKVSLFGNLKYPRWKSPSMDRYSSQLYSGLVSKDVEATLYEPEFPEVYNLLPEKYKFRLARFSFYPKFARKHTGEINHLTDHSYGQVSKFLEPSRTIITCHDLIPLRYEKDSFALRSFRESVAYLKKVGLVLADSEATKRDIVEHLEVDPNRIKVVYLGVSEAYQKLDKQTVRDFRNRYKLPDKPLLLHVGNNLPYKNTTQIIKALEELIRKNLDFTFVKVGPDLRPEGLLKEKYHHIPHVPESDLPTLYNSVDCLIYPSLTEGFGFPTLEAISCGTPVVVSVGTSLEEIAGEAGIYVDPLSLDSIIEAVTKALSLTDKEKNEIAEKGISQAKKFGWEKCVDHVYEHYQEILHD